MGNLITMSIYKPLIGLMSFIPYCIIFGEITGVFCFTRSYKLKRTHPSRIHIFPETKESTTVRDSGHPFPSLAQPPKDPHIQTIIAPHGSNLRLQKAQTSRAAFGFGPLVLVMIMAGQPILPLTYPYFWRVTIRLRGGGGVG